MTDWIPTDTTTHQDHVIAHVIGATVLAYLILDETLHLLLDIGFIWRIYVDGEMGLLPHPVALAELEAPEAELRQIRAEIELLLRDGFGVQSLIRLSAPPVKCMIEDVTFSSRGDERRLLLVGEAENLTIDMSLASGEISVSEA